MSLKDIDASLSRPESATVTVANAHGPGSRAGYCVPDEPLVTIEPIKSWSAFTVKELWGHRELLYFLTLRDMRVRYKQTLLGGVWVVLQPLLMTLVFTVFLGLVARITTPGIPYPLFVYSGLLPWMFISGGILGCSTSLTGNSNLLTKVYFPRILLPTAYLGTRILDLFISIVILAVLILIYHEILHFPVPLTWKLCLLPIVLFIMIIFTLSMGVLVSTWNVKYRDVGVALPVFIQLWMFTSPIVYPPDRVPEKWRLLYSLNPLVGMIQGFRGALLNMEIPTFALIVTTITTVVVALCAVFVFRKAEKRFADLV